MRFIDQNEVKNFIMSHNYDIRLSGNARWIDQKCTPDVLTIIADCVLEYVYDKENDVEFTSRDIWNNPYTDLHISSMFKKPSVMNGKAGNEYDKFFSQPLELFAYSGILTKNKRGRYNYYKVFNKDILTFLALREINSLTFLNIYCEKVLRDSGLFKVFEDFFENTNKDTFSKMKNSFVQFTIENTPITKPTEPRRIFTKVINPMAFTRNKKGTEKGLLSKNLIGFDMLMYNRENFRDMYSSKPKEITRSEHVVNRPQNPYNAYAVAKAIKMVKFYNNDYNFGKSEVEQYSHDENATHIHHIFTRESYPEISDYFENLIALTPTQHYNYAHVNGNTQIISKDFQYICILSKIGTIKKSYEMHNGLYEFHKMCFVLKTGLENDKYLDVPYLDFDQVVNYVNIDFNN